MRATNAIQHTTTAIKMPTITAVDRPAGDDCF